MPEFTFFLRIRKYKYLRICQDIFKKGSAVQLSRTCKFKFPGVLQDTMNPFCCGDGMAFVAYIFDMVVYPARRCHNVPVDRISNVLIGLSGDRCFMQQLS